MPVWKHDVNFRVGYQSEIRMLIWEQDTNLRAGCSIESRMLIQEWDANPNTDMPISQPAVPSLKQKKSPEAPHCGSAAVAVCGWIEHHLHLHPELTWSGMCWSCCAITMAPTSLIRASHSQTELLTLIPSSSRPLHGKVSQLRPGSQRGLKTRREEKRSAQQQQKSALLRTISFYGFLRPAAGESLSRFCAVSPVNK